MFESIGNFLKKMVKPENKELGSKDDAKERLHLVLMQDRANVSADFLDLMKQEIIDVIKKYIVVDEDSIDVRLTNKPHEDGTNGEPLLYASIPIINIKNDMKAEKIKEFEGVNFTKKLEEVENEEKAKAKVEETMREMIDSAETENDNNTENKVEEIKEDIKEETEEVKESEKEEKAEDVKEDIKEEKEETKGKNKKSSKKDNNKKSKKSKSKADEEPKDNEEDDDEEDDDDVTFDDLLKAAEEEDNKKVSEG